MNIRSFLTVAAALLSIGCTAPQGNPIAAMEADPQCQPYSGYFRQRSSIGLQDDARDAWETRIASGAWFAGSGHSGRSQDCGRA